MLSGRRRTPIAATILLGLLASSAFADEAGKLAKRALEQKAVFDKTYAAAVAAKKDLRWFDFLRDEIVKAHEGGNLRRLLALADSGQRILARDLKPLLKGDPDTSLRARAVRLREEFKTFAEWKMRPEPMSEFLEYAERLLDTGRKAEALAVLEEAERQMEAQKIQAIEIHARQGENEKMYAEAKRAGKDLSGIDAMYAQWQAANGEVPLLHEIILDANARLRAMLGLPAADAEGAAPAPGDPALVYKCEEFKFEIRKPAQAGWVFNRKDQEGFALEIKNDATWGYAEVSAWHEGNASLDDLVQNQQQEMQKWFRDYSEIGREKTKVDGKNAIQVMWNGRWKDQEGAPLLTAKRVYVRRSENVYILSWVTASGKLDANQKTLDEIIASFRFK